MINVRIPGQPHDEYTNITWEAGRRSQTSNPFIRLPCCICTFSRHSIYISSEMAAIASAAPSFLIVSFEVYLHLAGEEGVPIRQYTRTHMDGGCPLCLVEAIQRYSANLARSFAGGILMIAATALSLSRGATPLLQEHGVSDALLSYFRMSQSIGRSHAHPARRRVHC
jgi:hypothetical protein